MQNTFDIESFFKTNFPTYKIIRLQKETTPTNLTKLMDAILEKPNVVLYGNISIPTCRIILANTPTAGDHIIFNKDNWFSFQTDGNLKLKFKEFLAIEGEKYTCNICLLEKDFIHNCAHCNIQICDPCASNIMETSGQIIGENDQVLDIEIKCPSCRKMTIYQVDMK